MTNLVAKDASYLLWDLDDSFLLWLITPVVHKYIREIDLSFVIGSAAKYSELFELVDVFYGIFWLIEGRALKVLHPVVLQLSATLCFTTRTSRASSIVTLLGLVKSCGVFMPKTFLLVLFKCHRGV